MYPPCHLEPEHLLRAIEALKNRADTSSLAASEEDALRDWRPRPWRPDRTAREIIDENVRRNARVRAIYTLVGIDDGWALIDPADLSQLLAAANAGAMRMQIDLEEYIRRFGDWPADAVNPDGGRPGNSGGSGGASR